MNRVLVLKHLKVSDSNQTLNFTSSCTSVHAGETVAQLSNPREEE